MELYQHTVGQKTIMETNYEYGTLQYCFYEMTSQRVLTVEYPSAAQSSTSSNLLILKRQKGLYLAEVSFFKAQLDFFCVALSGIPEIQCLQELDTINKRWQNKTAGALGLPNYTPRVHSLPFLKVTLRNHSFYSEPKCSYFFSN